MSFYLVTGGAGFIGSHLVETLLKRGERVRVLDNFSSGKRENLAGMDGALEILEGDLRDAAAVEKAVAGVEVIFHEAAFVSVPESMSDPVGCFAVNVTGTASLLEAARQAKVRRVVLASSAAVYGDSETNPVPETEPLQSLSPYAASKQINEVMAGLYTNLGLPTVALRYFNVFGPRQRPDSMYAAAVPIFVRRMLDNRPVTIFGDGGQSRDLIYVGDVVRANLVASEHENAPGRVFNVCTGRETRILDLLETLSELFPGIPPAEFAPPRPGDIYRSVGDPAKAARLLGFEAQTSLAEGLADTVDWMRG
ncbi:MAG: SDR family oxidoreductase [Chloroflexota bacterium]